MQRPYTHSHSHSHTDRALKNKYFQSFAAINSKKKCQGNNNLCFFPFYSQFNICKPKLFLLLVSFHNAKDGRFRVKLARDPIELRDKNLLQQFQSPNYQQNHWVLLLQSNFSSKTSSVAYEFWSFVAKTDVYFKVEFK